MISGERSAYNFSPVAPVRFASATTVAMSELLVTARIRGAAGVAPRLVSGYIRGGSCGSRCAAAETQATARKILVKRLLRGAIRHPPRRGTARSKNADLR